MSVFRYTDDEYKLVPRLKPVREYIEQQAQFLTGMTDMSLSEAMVFVKSSIRDREVEVPANNPETEYYLREPNGDKHLQTGTLTSYLTRIEEENLAVAPSMTTYVKADVKPSPLVGFLVNNIATRSVAKKAAFERKAKGDMEGFTAYNNVQQTKKTYNNSLSGLLAGKGTALYNYSGHYTLTSTTRCVTGYGNAVTEQMVAGNRHYRNGNVTLNHIITLAGNTDHAKVMEVISKYDINVPSADDIFHKIIKPSSKYYWEDARKENTIYDYLQTLTVAQRAVVSFTGDIYHLRVFNSGLMREFFKRLSRKETLYSQDFMEVVKSQDESVLSLAHHICSKELEGLGTDYELMDERGVLGTVAGTCLNVVRTLESYQDLLAVFLVTNNMPVGIGYLKDMVRKVVVVSDTDSTCGAYQEWVEWYFGQVVFTPEAIALAAAVMIVNTQTIAHTLKLFSAQMGVDDLDLLSMKNEFYWTVMVPTNVTKHYFAGVKVQEGNVFKELDLEYKGVHLISGNTSPVFREAATDMMKHITTTISNGHMIVIRDMLRKVLELETMLRDSLLRGEHIYFVAGRIKTADSYTTSPETSPYNRHVFWNTCFGEVYGTVPEPPYTTIKVSTTLVNKTAMVQWLKSMEGTTTGDNIAAHLQATNRTTLPTIHIPRVKAMTKIPDEVLAVLDIPKITLDNMRALYFILETLGFVMKPDNTLTEAVGHVR